VCVCDKEPGFLFPKDRGSGSERYRREEEGGGGESASMIKVPW